MNPIRPLLLVLLSMAACAFHSNLTVPPQQQFVLGGEQEGAFSVEYRNTGSQTVLLAEVGPDGGLLRPLVVEPGDSGKARFPPGATVLVINEHSKAARLELDLRGDVGGGMGMRYEATVAE